MPIPSISIPELEEDYYPAMPVEKEEDKKFDERKETEVINEYVKQMEKIRSYILLNEEVPKNWDNYKETREKVK